MYLWSIISCCLPSSKHSSLTHAIQQSIWSSSVSISCTETFPISMSSIPCCTLAAQVKHAPAWHETGISIPCFSAFSTMLHLLSAGKYVTTSPWSSTIFIITLLCGSSGRTPSSEGSNGSHAVSSLLSKSSVIAVIYIICTHKQSKRNDFLQIYNKSLHFTLRGLYSGRASNYLLFAYYHAHEPQIMVYYILNCVYCHRYPWFHTSGYTEQSPARYLPC